MRENKLLILLENKIQMLCHVTGQSERSGLGKKGLGKAAKSPGVAASRCDAWDAHGHLVDNSVH